MVVDRFGPVAIADEKPAAEVGSAKESEREVAGIEVDTEVESIGMDRNHRIRVIFMAANAVKRAVPATETPITKG